jgi:glycosyltransferase involved in cell wall biosynthesis
MADRPALIFHHPLPVESDPRVGSTAHVTHMIGGFGEAGYDVELVTGYSMDRLRAMRRVRHQIRDGRRFDFLYAEASTAPTAMNDPRHLPLRPLMDWRFLRAAKHAGIPVGLFYPDIHWRFDQYLAKVPIAKRLPATAFYRFDLAWYRNVLDTLFLPSRRMRDSVPGWQGSARACGLAPGGVIVPTQTRADGDVLRLLYVGAVTPPLYDIGVLVRAVADSPGVELTICCPQSATADLPAGVADPSITVVHRHGEDLRALYAACDIACLVYPPHPYRAFAMPVKLFEAIGAGKPTVVSSGTSAAEFIDRTGFGWVVHNDKLPALLRALRAHPEEVAARSSTTVTGRGQHTWRARAEYVAAVMLGAADRMQWP